MKKYSAFLSFFLLFAIAGCAATTSLLLSPFAAPIEAGVLYWVGGEGQKYYEEDAKAVYRATKHALVTMDLPITEDKVKNNRFHLDAGNKQRFSIRIESADHNLTRLCVRCNFMGDKELAEILYKHVDEELNVIHFNSEGNPTYWKN